LKKITIITIILIILIAISFLLAHIYTTNHIEEQPAQNNTNETTQPQGYIQELESGVKLNTHEKLNQTRQWEGLEFRNIQLSSQSAITTLQIDVQNINTTATALKNITITLVDKQNQPLETFKGVIKPLEPQETTTISMSVTSDCIDAYDFIIE